MAFIGYSSSRLSVRRLKKGVAEMHPQRKARQLFLVALVGGITASNGHAQSLRDQLLGTWEAVSWVQLVGDVEEPGPLGREPLGLIMYMTDGHMCANGMRPNRTKFSRLDFRGASPEEKANAFESFFGYCGRYEVNESEGYVSHNVMISSFPNYAGTTQKRFVRMNGDQMTLTTPVRTIGGREVTDVITWRRAR
jgi:hypothetical protein